MLKRISVVTSTLALALAALAGCSLETSEPATSTQSPILGGAATNDPKYQAVGAIYVEIPDFDFFDVICSATLVGPQAIVTARHCTPTIMDAMDFGGTAYMAFGANAFAPDQLVPIVDFVSAPPSPNHPGLLQDGGRDVAVAHLASVPAGIRPAKLGRFDNDMLGKKFDIVGYGANNADFFYGEKFAGRATARALRGRWYRLLFSHNKRDFLDWYFTDANTNPTQAEAEAWWDGFPLEPRYELLAGGLEGEAVACFGDSGGPIVRGNKASNLTVYGVGFAVEASKSELCDKGGGYAVLNREMLDFVEDNLSGVLDPAEVFELEERRDQALGVLRDAARTGLNRLLPRGLAPRDFVSIPRQFVTASRRPPLNGPSLAPSTSEIPGNIESFWRSARADGRGGG